MVTKKPLSEDISIRQTENIGIITLDFPGALHWSQYKVKIITILSKIAPNNCDGDTLSWGSNKGWNGATKLILHEGSYLL